MNGTIPQTRRCALAPFSILAALVVMAGPPQLAHGTQGFQRSEQTATANQAGAAHLYFFTNPGCAPCRQVEPGIHALAAEGYPVTTIMLNEHPDWGTRFSVDRTPTVILVANGKIAGRQAGLIDGVTLKKWFAAVGVRAGSNFAGQTGGTKVSLPATSSFAASPATLHHGTTRPASENESRALAATVRLKVEDPEGISYATGTVIHYHNGECLVMTCGHVFRDADGKGAITAEFGFADGRVQSASGQLIAYDADARDIALVAVNTNTPIEAVAIADKRSTVDKGLAVFSIGCDGGDQPTIRHSRIKNRAAYDGAIKYDIYGRPVSGRSGGGLFNSDGELIGVCNAAAVEVDEGIYTGLETVHWQIANVNLQHLFDDATVKQSLVAGSQNEAANPNRFAEMPVDDTTITQTNAPKFAGAFSTAAGQRPLAPIKRPDSSRSANTSAATPVAWSRPAGQSQSPQPDTPDDGGEMEVIIIVRSKANPNHAEAITVSHPSSQLLNYLGNMQSQSAQPRQIDVANLRTESGTNR